MKYMSLQQMHLRRQKVGESTGENSSCPCLLANNLCECQRRLQNSLSVLSAADFASEGRSNRGIFGRNSDVIVWTRRGIKQNTKWKSFIVTSSVRRSSKVGQ